MCIKARYGRSIGLNRIELVMENLNKLRFQKKKKERKDKINSKCIMMVSQIINCERRELR